MQEYLKGHHPGAVWKKTDLQNHTPRDPGWDKSPHLSGGDEESEKARSSWAKGFLNACIERGLTAVAITDHHDMCMVKYARELIEEENSDYGDLWLFPGIEITCDDSSQCIVLFASNFDLANEKRLYGGILKDVEQVDPNQDTLEAIDLCGSNIETVIGLINEDTVLGKNSIVLPHGGKDGAHKTVLRTGFHSRFSKLNADGVYCEHPYSEYPEGTLRIVKGEIDAWGNRKRGIITTGDNRDANFSKLGVNACWIRLGEPTAEAIRQAVLADEARISYQEPILPLNRILQLDVNSSLCGSSFSITFNDGFNAIIGGRGAGKSAVLEYLRFSLGRSSIDISTTIDEQSREGNLLQETLKDGGSVTVRLARNNITESWSRTIGSSSIITIENEDGSVEEIPTRVAHERFQARGFSQKQLSSLISNEQSAETQITSIASAEFVEQRKAIETKIRDQQRKIHELLAALSNKWVVEYDLLLLDSNVADLTRRRASINKKMKDEGLSEEHQKTIELQPRYAESEAYIESISGEVNDLDETILEISGRLLTESKLPNGFPEERFGSVNGIKEELDTARNKIRNALNSVSDEVESLSDSIEKRQSEFNQEKIVFEREYSSAKSQKNAFSTLLEEQTELTKKIQQLTNRRVVLEREVSKFKNSEDHLDAAQDDLNKFTQAMCGLLTTAADTVSTMSEGLLDASVETKNSSQSILSALLELGAGAGIHGVDEKVEAMISDSFQGGSIGEWNALCTVLIEALKSRTPEGAAPSPGTGDLNLPQEKIKDNFFGGLTNQQAQKVYERIDVAKVAAVLGAVRDVFISFKYRDDGQYISFEQASPGQQAAALLELLLNQEAGTLIIDQPEDDLDNKVIMKIATLLQRTKSKRQLVFSTHNPNFVVNGDADKVIALGQNGTANSEEQQERIAILADGAIETTIVKNVITEVMEGGKSAFELRGRKYQFID